MIQEFLGERWESMLGEGRPRSVRVLKLSARPGQYSSVSLLAFADGREVPSLLVKINRDPGYPHAILSEYRNFSTIYQGLQDCRASVPRPLGCWEVDDHVALCETVVPGKPIGGRTFLMPTVSKRERVFRFVLSALEWLANFHAETHQGHVVMDRAFVRENFEIPVEGVLDRHRDAMGGRETILHKLPRAAANYLGTALPVGAVQGDFTHANILLQARQIGVVDWEDCEIRGLPFRDVFFLICQMALNFEAKRSGTESFRSFLLGDPGSRLVLEAFGEYARWRGLDTRLFALMLPQFMCALLMSQLPVHRARQTYLFASPECLTAALDFFDRVF